MDKAKLYQRAVEILDEYGYDSEFRPDYSGRGMHRKTTPAIVTGAPLSVIGWAVTVAYYDNEPGNYPEEAYDYLPQRSDQMGLSMVYY